MFSLFAILVVGTFAGPRLEAAPHHENQVGICHFNGHDGDFVLGNQTQGARNGACLVRSVPPGLVLYVSERSCERGHDADPTPWGSNAGLKCDLTKD